MSYGLFHTGGQVGYPNDKAVFTGLGLNTFYMAAAYLALLIVACLGRRRWVLLGVVLCFAFFTVLPLLESVVPLTEFRELVDQSALAQVFENGNLIISIMNRRL